MTKVDFVPGKLNASQMKNRDANLADATRALAHLQFRPRFTPGALFYQVYHRPAGWLKRVRSVGVPCSTRGAFARRKLHYLITRAEPSVLPVANSNRTAALTVDLLTGRGFFVESVAVARSLAHASSRSLDLHFYDDGTLGTDETAVLTRWFPKAKIHGAAELQSNLTARLPPSRFPILHALRNVYIPIKKLTDIAALQTGWRLFVDSDVLFFGPPRELLNHIERQQPCHIVDHLPCYGASNEFLANLAGRPVPTQANTGLYFRDVDSIDWNFLEHSARCLLQSFGFSYFLEQALAALLFARESAVPLGGDYVVLPDEMERWNPTKVALHYVSQTRWAFYVHACRQLEPTAP